MIVTGMSLNVTGSWEESQGTTNLQILIAKYRNHFEGVEEDGSSALEENEEEAIDLVE